ncbi:MAG TPA: hypothetical protein VFA89_12235 [Terriglobales bacterium]|nr:hypothetical protein [Terriglobales bacterium]
MKVENLNSKISRIQYHDLIPDNDHLGRLPKFPRLLPTTSLAKAGNDLTFLSEDDNHVARYIANKYSTSRCIHGDSLRTIEVRLPTPGFLEVVDELTSRIVDQDGLRAVIAHIYMTLTIRRDSEW